MSDRAHSITVVLADNVRVDDLAPLLTAIRQLRGVVAVETNVSDLSEFVAETRVYLDMRKRLIEALDGARGSR